MHLLKVNTSRQKFPLSINEIDIITNLYHIKIYGSWLKKQTFGGSFNFYPFLSEFCKTPAVCDFCKKIS